MKRILVFGLSGQVGQALLPLLLDSAYQTTALSRQTQVNQDKVTWHQAGFENFVLNDVDYDAVISLGPLDAFSDWLAASNIRVNKIVALSSTSLVTKKDSPDPKEQMLSRSLQTSESSISSFANTIQAGLILLRPTLMYGFGRDQSVSRWLAMAKRFNVVLLPKDAAGLRQPVHLYDVASAIMAALKMTMSNREICIFDLPGAEKIGFDQMLLRALQVHAPKTRVLRIPNGLLRGLVFLAQPLGVASGLGPGFFARLQQDWLFDPAPAELALGYRPRPFSP
jgi:nucleoside-diphosphate-sugar epimerase